MTLLKFTTVKNVMEECMPIDDKFLVAEKAVNQMSWEIDKFVKRVTLKAWKMAQFAKRKTIKPEDIVMAMEILRSQNGEE